MKVNFDIEQNPMRKEMKLIRTYFDLTSKDIANELGISLSSFNQWICGRLDFGEERKRWVQLYIDDMKAKSISDMIKGE